MFKLDLARAGDVELAFVKEILKPWVVRIEMPSDEEQFKDRDIKVTYKDGKEVTFEVKGCPRANEYGSIPFESECNGEPSGIYASKADYVVYYFDDTWYYQDRWKLLHDLVSINKYETFWWDGERAKMYVVDLEVAKLLFKKL